jgi:hypothetical protein
MQVLADFCFHDFENSAGGDANPKLALTGPANAPDPPKSCQDPKFHVFPLTR